jgi:hypothetical protein
MRIKTEPTLGSPTLSPRLTDVIFDGIVLARKRAVLWIHPSDKFRQIRHAIGLIPNALGIMDHRCIGHNQAVAANKKSRSEAQNGGGLNLFGIRRGRRSAGLGRGGFNIRAVGGFGRFRTGSGGKTRSSTALMRNRPFDWPLR